MAYEGFVFLEDVADKLEEVNEDWRTFFNTKSGEFVSAQNEHLGIAEDLGEVEVVDEDSDELDEAEDEDSDELNEAEDEGIPEDALARYSDWEREAIQEAVEILENWDDYIELPSQYDIHEYSIMEDFAASVSNDHKREMLEVALEGRGAFRRFKDTLIRTGLEEKWYGFRFEAFVGIAKEWCEDNNISYKMKNKIDN